MEVTENKRSRGRIRNSVKGIECRKQYTLTLPEQLYNQIMKKAKDERLSFALYMERAVIEYMDRHYNEQF